MSFRRSFLTLAAAVAAGGAAAQRLLLRESLTRYMPLLISIAPPVAFTEAVGIEFAF
jgi:hypothetical protein